VQQLFVVLLVAAAYLGLAALSALLAYSPADAWTVWLASGLTLGLLLARPLGRWPAILAGAFAGAAIFALLLGSNVVDAFGYGVIEVITAAAGAWIAARAMGLPARLEEPRDFAALVFGGALPLAVLGALIASAWNVASGGTQAIATFRVWGLANFVGTLLVAPLVIAWAHFRPKRSGGMPMPAFVAGAILCVIFLLSMHLLMHTGNDDRLGGNVGRGLLYEPIVFMALLALVWGLAGATLAAALGSLIALINTAHGLGPFAGVQGYLGDPELEVQAYAAAVAATGILIALLAASQRRATRAARDWQTRFEAAIGIHRLVAYEWDPASGGFTVTGDAAQLLGAAAGKVASLADWLGLVAPEDRERVAARFEARAISGGDADAIAYLMQVAGSSPVAISDDARAIRDHDGALHRIAGIVRVAAAPQVQGARDLAA
jgi:integral membrane sensor domain MASE1